MCGIAGILTLSNTAQCSIEQLQTMGATLSHRGPDGSGVYLDPQYQCGLVHTRLAVLDIPGGAQPMTNEDRTIWITYNGECYNCRDLRYHLAQKGHTFRTLCDTEVIIHLYEQYGHDCVQHIRGMFAFAIWDQAKRELFLARDRLGQKPLFFAITDDFFLFGSQPRALLPVDFRLRKVNEQALRSFLLLGYSPGQSSGFADIRQLPPAHYFIIKPLQNDVRLCPYWQLPPPGSFAGDPVEAEAAVSSELTAATNMRMISDVPLGAFLSGGIDSSVIVGLMSQGQPRPVRTCSIGFTDRRYNELPFARQVSRHFACEAFEELITPDPQAAVNDLPQVYDEPFADSSALPTCQLARLARKHVTVALSGDGGDELFCGYDRYRAMQIAETCRRFRLCRWLSKLRFWQHVHSGEYRSRWRRIRRFITALALPADQRYLQWIAVFSPDWLGQLFPSSDQGDQSLYTPFFSPEPDNADQVMESSMRADLAFYLPGDLNTKTDRASMAAGLEVRSPFQDHKLVELVFSIPASWRRGGRLGKGLLRNSFADLLPPEILQRRKAGFGVPVGQWFRGPLHDVFTDMVLSPRSLQRGWFDPSALHRLWQEHLECRDDHGQKLWALLMLECWQRRWIDASA